MSTLTSDQMRAIDQTRTRLDQLTKSIGALRNDLLRGQPMPPIDSIQVHSTILAQNLKSLTDHLSRHADLFSSVLVFPSTNFPGRTQEGLIGQLLRKKLEPNVETWVEEGRALGSQTDGEEELDGLWEFARAYVTPAVAKAAQGSRDLLEDIYNESEEEEEGGEEEEGEEVVAGGHAYGDGGKGNPEGVKRDLDAIARFMTTGVVR